jgi:lysophospholipase L1-like esterase
LGKKQQLANNLSIGLKTNKMKKLSPYFSWKYILFLTVFCIICLEIFGKIYLTYVLKKSTNQKFQFDSYRIYSHIPNFKEGDKNGDWIAINSQGFRRNTDVPLKKDSNTFRIFLMGGSTAHGLTSAPPFPIVNIYMNETIDYYLEEKFKQKYPNKKIEVINAAVTGYRLSQHTAYLLSELLNYKPDMVVFLDGANDHYMYDPNLGYMSDNIFQFWKPRLQKPSIMGWLDYGILTLAKYSSFARGLYSWRLIKDVGAREPMPPIFKTSEALIAAHEETAKKGFLRSMEANIVILKANNIKTFICLQPELILRQQPLLSEPEKLFYPLITSKDAFIPPLYPHVLKYVNELTSKYQIPFMDLNTEFNKNEYKNQQLLIDYCHLTPLGGQVVANAIFNTTDSLYRTTNKM